MKELDHKFERFTNEGLLFAINSLDSRIRQLQAMKQHRTAEGRKALSVFQSRLHSMRLEHKRRECATKRAKANV